MVIIHNRTTDYHCYKVINYEYLQQLALLHSLRKVYQEKAGN